MAAKHGMKTMAGVLDHTYRGELKIVLLNTTGAAYEIKKGDRIAQLLIQPIITTEVIEVAELEETVRGDGNFGSSGR
jgi:dUTP pyrophosphatase